MVFAPLRITPTCSPGCARYRPSYLTRIVFELPASMVFMAYGPAAADIEFQYKMPQVLNAHAIFTTIVAIGRLFIRCARFGMGMVDVFLSKTKAASRGRTAMQRIVLLGLTLALTAVANAPQAHAEDFPSRPLHLIIGFPPGSAADITARLVGDAMSQTLRQQVVVESRPGAGSSIAAEFVVRAPADGYTLYIGTSSNLTNAAISSNLHFDFGKDFAPITPLTSLPLILAVHPSLGVSSVKELIELAKAKPGELTYASVGLGTV